jgi:hypothetical protein
MKRVLFSLLLGATAALVVLPGTALGAEYEAFVGCDDLAENPIPSHECQIGDFPGAFFESNEDVEYDVCIEFPDTEFLCAEEQFAEAGFLYVNSITTNEPGMHYVSWYLTGTETEIGFWAFDMKEPPAPPPPPPPAPASTLPASTPAGQSTACVAARKRVRRLNGQLHRALGKKQKARIRAKLRKARAVVRREC